MDLTTYSECSCASCGFIIDYRASRAGEVIECPQCGVKSCLPEARKLGMLEHFGPPVPTVKSCATCQAEMAFSQPACPECDHQREQKWSRKKLVIGISAAALACVAGLVISISHARKVSARSAQIAAHPAHGSMMIEQAKPSALSQTGLRAGKFDLQASRGSEVLVAVGDIQNDSEQTRRGLRADLDLIDRRGAKIGTVSDYLPELAPHQCWHFLTTVDNTNAIRLRLAQITENN